MYVCVCRAISDRQIREVVDRGAKSLCEVQAYLPVANCCGSCEDTAREIIDRQSLSVPRQTSS
jgi:bacterioferritin-associated ferredoxin